MATCRAAPATTSSATTLPNSPRCCARLRARAPRMCSRTCAPRTGHRRVRIARLDLTRYGRFSDYQLDFGAAPPDGSDFHIVYGLNETGKSTAAAAILDLLFGIEKQSAYGAAKGRASVPNWHAYNAMRIGARLELGGRRLRSRAPKARQEQPCRCQRSATRREHADGGARRRRSRMLSI